MMSARDQPPLGGWDVDFVARNARDAPTGPAVCEVCDDAVGTRILSWLELDAAVEACARAIRARTPPGTRVACVARDGVAPLVALHACYRARRAFVAMDHASWPSVRLRAIAVDARCASVVCADDDETRRARGWFGDTIDAYVSLESLDARRDDDDDDDDERRSPDEPLEDDRNPRVPSLAANDPASSSSRELYVAYTSGSSGFGAKGTVALADAVMSYCAAKMAVERVRSSSGVCLASNPTFDIYPSDAYVAAASRACAVVASRTLFQADFTAVLRRGAVTHVCCTPTLFSLARLPGGWDDAPRLRVVSLAGERMSAETLELWGGGDEDDDDDDERRGRGRDKDEDKDEDKDGDKDGNEEDSSGVRDFAPRGRRVLFNVYGATEATVLQTYARMRRGDDLGRVGRPYRRGGFASVHVVERTGDGRLVFLEPGATGEVAVSGRCVCRGGYLNDPERTARAFIDVGGDVGVVYATGDVGRVDANGHLILSGRADRRVKIRGVRTELDEIESHVRSCVDLVENAAVDFDPSTQTVTAHVQVRPEGYEPATQEWIVARAVELFVRNLAPAHAVPTRYALYRRFDWPLTSSGKTDRVALTAGLGDGAKAAFRPERVPPRPGLETALAAAWAASLGLSSDDVGASDGFDALGGNSLNVLDVSRRLAADPRISYPRGEGVDNPRTGDDVEAPGFDAEIVDGEAAALLRRGEADEPAACAAGVVRGPFAPCEILARPVLRDYAEYLRAEGVAFDNLDGSNGGEDKGGEDGDGSGGGEDGDGSGGDRRLGAEPIDVGGDSLERCALAACSLGAAPVVRSLLKSGVRPRGSHLRAAAAVVSPADALETVAALLAAGADPNEASAKGTLATHVAAARGNCAVLVALLEAGARAGAKDRDKQTALHLAARSGDVETVRAAARFAAGLRTRDGGLESWDRWKRTASAWALRAGDAECLKVLADGGATLTGLERDVSAIATWRHGSLSERSESQLRSRPERKRSAAAEVVEALAARLAADADEDDAAEAASALRELVCANARNRRAAGRAGAVPRLLDRIRRLTCVDSIGALRNIANDAAASREAGELGAVDVLADVVRAAASNGGQRGVRGGGVDRRVAFAAGSALRSLTLKDAANAERVSRLGNVLDLVNAAGTGDAKDPEDLD